MTTLQTKSTCPYCGVGCGVIIEHTRVAITGVRGDPDHPANFGRLCSKGLSLHQTVTQHANQEARLLHPMLRTPGTRGLAGMAHLKPVCWDTALNVAAKQFSQVIDKHGPDAVGFYVSGQLLTEDYYVFNKLAKGVIGTNNIDTNSRLCMSSAVAGYKQSLGADAVPTCYDDVNHAQCIFIVGSNTAFAHPVLFRRIEDAKAKNPKLRLIVCDPRRTDTAELADLYLPVKMGTDVMLFNAMLYIMLDEGWVDEAFVAQHCSGFEPLRELVQNLDIALAATTCGVTQHDLYTAAQWFACSKATLSLYCQGLNQSSSGTAKNTALINLHLATGHIGRAGAGPFSLTGQPNAMGGREVGGLSNLMSAHRDMANPTHRAEVEHLWGLDQLGAAVPSHAGLTAVELFEAAADGVVKALWIACTNPMQSMPNLKTVRAALQRAELVVLQEAFAHTETAAYADVLLPATTWGEKTGTVTNSERRISRVHAALGPLGEARHDWQIARDFALRLEPSLVRPIYMNYPNAEAIWNEHRDSTRGRDLDITALSYSALDAQAVQWPCPKLVDVDVAISQSRERLYTDHRFATPDGKARFVSSSYTPVADANAQGFPVSLTTGRLRDQWHSMSRTGLVARLFGAAPEPVVELSPSDMAARQLKRGDLVYVTSRRGAILIPAVPSESLHQNQAFIAMHWGAHYLSGKASNGEALLGVNQITTQAFCPDSKQPELKHTAVKIVPASLPWHLYACAWLPSDRVLPVQQELQGLLKQFEFASLVPVAHATEPSRSGLVLRCANFEPVAAEIVELIRCLLGLNAASVLSYADKRKNQARWVRIEGEALTGFLLVGDVQSSQWMHHTLAQGDKVLSLRRFMLQASTAAPDGLAPTSTMVCTCVGVSEAQIKTCIQTPLSLSADEQLARLQTKLRCGTQCGSCVPSLKRLIREAHSASAT